MLTEESATKIFNSYINRSSRYKRAIEVARGISDKDIWLCGGSVYRLLAHKLHGAARPNSDFDFIFAQLPLSFCFPSNYSLDRNHFGNIKLTNGDSSIDCIPFNNILAFRVNSLTPSIENYLAHVPLNLHSIVYSLNERRIIGPVGINAINDRLVRVHDLNNCRYESDRKRKSLKDFIKEKAESLGFGYQIE